MTPDILIINSLLVPLAPDLPETMAPGYVAIRAGKIVSMGMMADLLPGQSAGKVIDAAGKLLMPGLINCHCHAAMTMFRGLADDLPLSVWLYEHIFPAEARVLSPETVYWGTRLAALEMIRAGITTVADGYFYEDDAARAFLDSGLRAVAAQGVIDFPAPGVPYPKDNVRYATEYIDQWQGQSALVTPAVFCHSPSTCSAATLRAAKEMAREKKVLFFIHVAETRDENALIRKEHGCTPVQWLNGLGVLDADTVCVHCVWLEETDLDILAATGVKVAHCQQSNMKLASGVAPVVAMLSRGIPIGLGTDGCASNNRLDLFGELDSTAKFAKAIAKDPTVLPASKALTLAASGAADVLGMRGAIGGLTPGMRADLILLNTNQAHLVPLYHAHSHLVYTASGADVETVIINGQVVMERGEILLFDAAEVLARVRALCL